MLSNTPRSFSSVAAVSLLLTSLAARAQDEPAAVTFGEQVEVTVVELMVEPYDKKGRIVRDLTVADFQVWEDGEPVEVLGLDYPAPGGQPALTPEPDRVTEVAASQASAGEAEEAGAPAPSSWRYVVYFDAPLTSRGTIRRAVDVLDERVSEMVARGPVEIVMANPEPRIVQSFTRDPERIRKALKAVDEENTQHPIQQQRQDYVRFLDARFQEHGGATQALENRIRTDVRRENAFVEGRVREMSEWMAVYGYQPSSAAILVTDGFDLQPVDFYAGSTSVEISEAVRADLLDQRSEKMVDAVSRQLGATGWTSLLMSFGSRATVPVAGTAAFGQRDRFRSIAEDSARGPSGLDANTLAGDSVQPLRMVAAETGGEVVTTRKKAGVAVDQLSERPRLTYLAPRGRDGEVHQVRVETTRDGVNLRSTRWVRSPTKTQITDSRARRLLVQDSDAGELPVQLEVPTVGAKNQGARSIVVDVVFDLNLLRPILEDSEVPMSLTFGVEIPHRPPFVHQLEQTFDLPSGSGSEWPAMVYRTEIAVPADTELLSIVVEEPATGIWGGAVARVGAEGGGGEPSR